LGNEGNCNSIKNICCFRFVSTSNTSVSDNTADSDYGTIEVYSHTLSTTTEEDTIDQEPSTIPPTARNPPRDFSKCGISAKSLDSDYMNNIGDDDDKKQPPSKLRR